MAKDMERLKLIKDKRSVGSGSSVCNNIRCAITVTVDEAVVLLPPAEPQIGLFLHHREKERQARITKEGWDRFAPVTETNKPPTGAPRPGDDN